MTKTKDKSDILLIKKYANRRLYDTQRSAYITHDDLCALVKKDVEFKVVDAETDADLTRSVLTQIIFEQETKGYSVLPINFLRQIIKFYDNNLRSVLPSYLESTMDYFSNNQEKMRGFMGGIGMDPLSPFKQFEDIGRQNMELLDKTMNMWTKFNPMMGDNFAGGGKGKKDNK